MPLSRKVRATFAVTRALSVVGLAPTTDKALKMSMDKRLAAWSGKRMIGPLPEVPSYDVQVPTRDGALVRVRVYAPEGATAPVLYAHGGGFAIGGIMACDHICRRLAVEAGVVVASVEYRLAPEHPFPGPLQDVEDAFDWLLAQEWDTSRVVVGGDSAGGNLAAALALKLRDRGTPIAGQLLVYPALDMTASGRGVVEYRGPGISTEEMQLCARLYLNGGDPKQPYASPVHAPDLTGLPPALVLVVEVDPLREEGLLYADRLRDAGVPLTLVDVPGHVHGSLSLPVLYDGIDEVYAQLTAFLRDPVGAAA